MKKDKWYRDPIKIAIITLIVTAVSIVVMVVLQVLDWTVFNRILESIKIW